MILNNPSNNLGPPGSHCGIVKPYSVLFVCWANVCRSQIAKSITQKLVQIDSVAGSICADAAGVSVSPERIRPSWQLRWAAFRRGYSIPRKPKQLSRLDLNRVDLVVAVDRQCLYAIKTYDSNPKARVTLMSNFLDSQWPIDVPDPMNRSIATCHKSIDMMETAIPRIIKYARSAPRRPDLSVSRKLDAG